MSEPEEDTTDGGRQRRGFGGDGGAQNSADLTGCAICIRDYGETAFHKRIIHVNSSKSETKFEIRNIECAQIITLSKMPFIPCDNLAEKQKVYIII